jgi:prevent-host-death family protein
VAMKGEEKTTAQIAEFKAHLGQYLRQVKNGQAITLLDRNTPVACVLPHAQKPGKLSVQKASLKPEQFKLTAPFRKQVDVLHYLSEERTGHR